MKFDVATTGDYFEFPAIPQGIEFHGYTVAEHDNNTEYRYLVHARMQYKDDDVYNYFFRARFGEDCIAEDTEAKELVDFLIVKKAIEIHKK